MAKQKAPTPQELYQQRRLREEQERTAYLPPGLINHGNTCFMNSVLQGLIATQLLSDLVHFAPVPQSVQDRAPTLLAGQRSPQLTNGHNLSGPHEKPWVNTMPIGDVFLSVMYKAWNAQARRERVALSPRALLGTLGKKYDQYLDFAQQDAHEFLRILLDAMRMEELDIIKLRQPPPLPKPKVRRRATVVPHIPSNSPDPVLNIDVARQPEGIPEEEKLVSFADLIFGGKLTSILVCQKCKNVSQTYEDFNDISLSIKPEDNLHRTRDKLKNFAKRLTAFPSSSSSAPSPFRLAPSDLQRPSSVPPSPKERPDGQLISRDETPPTLDARRRSLDIPADEPRSEEPRNEGGDQPAASKEAIQTADASQSEPESESGHVLVNVSGPEGKHIDFVEVPEKHEKKEKKEDTNWAKLGRRLSLGLGRSKERKSRSSERAAHRVSAPIIEGVPMLSPEGPKANRLSTESNPTPRASLSSVAKATSGRVPSPDTRLSPGSKQFLSDSPRPSAETTRPVSPSTLNPNAASIRPATPRSKSPKPPKPTPAEAEYLRKILADVSTPGPGNPLSTLFKGQTHGHHQPHLGHGKGVGSPLSSHNVWLGIHQLSGIEECLRMFTAVEVLDGENMVGCRRCWKIANGQMPKSKDEEVEDESSDSAGQNSPTTELHPVDDRTPLPLDAKHIRPPHVPHIQTSAGVHIPTSISTPTVSFFAETDQQEVYNSDARSISSLPPATSPGSGLGTEGGSTTTLDSSNTRSSPARTSSVSELSVDGVSVSSPGGLPIPIISTTAPDQPPSFESSDGRSSPNATPVVGSQTPAVVVQAVNGIVAPQPTRPSNLIGLANTESKDSLPVPPTVYRAGRKQGDATTDEESSADESDTSYGTSVSAESGGRSDASPAAPPGLGILGTPTADARLASKPQKKKASKPKPVIMRPAYKRYLVDTPPPVLVVHLKRFQQLAKTPFLSFSHGFKKLDDYVTFPEHLDLTPYLAPKKEDYGLDKKKKGRSDAWRPGKSGKGRDERCMYRLYAVVVHIGNMLGGHYIAYVALPTKSPLEGEGLAYKKPEPEPSSEGAATLAVPTPNPPPAPSPASPPAPAPRSPDARQPQTADKPRQWAYISDTIVRLTTLEEVLSAKAYICMYERC